MIWDDIERTPGQWDFQRYDWVYDAAAANGIRIAATLCAEDPPGWTRQTSFYHQRTDLNDPQRRKHAAAYLEKVVTRYRNHPAQGYWLLMNEPTLPQCFTQPMMARFGQWLQRRYGTVDQLNGRWFRPLTSFSEVQLDPAQWNTSWKDYPSYVDWKEFNIDNLCDQLHWIGSRVRELDPIHPTHANPHGLLGTLLPAGKTSGARPRRLISLARPCTRRGISMIFGGTTSGWPMPAAWIKYGASPTGSPGG